MFLFNTGNNFSKSLQFGLQSVTLWVDGFDRDPLRRRIHCVEKVHASIGKF